MSGIRPTWSPEVSLGNVIQIVSVLVAGVLWYASVENKLSTIEERARAQAQIAVEWRAAADQRIKSAAADATVARNQADDLTRDQASGFTRLGNIEQKLEVGRDERLTSQRQQDREIADLRQAQALFAAAFDGIRRDLAELRDEVARLRQMMEEERRGAPGPRRSDYMWPVWRLAR